ncbi:MAG TPA: sigma-70 family RNA polymerase sigma factor [Balneolaceae bacterium]|nr:sigma-70 family RNA polymerase sigma factor [Balneolaceae bacterium]
MATEITGGRQDGKSFNPKRLWEEFLKGDGTAFGKIFKFYYQDLYGYGLKFCQKPDMVKDCIQEVFANIGESRRRLGKVESVKAYLIVTLRRTLLKRLERRRTQETKMDEHVQRKSFQLSPEDIIIHEEIDQEQRHALKEALQTLPSRQKEVLFLRYFNGMSYNEIEQILSINYQSIRNHVYRATKRLKNILDKNDALQRLYSSETTASELKSGGM